jgi:hypothetical protein
VLSEKSKETTDNGLQTLGRLSLGSDQRSVVGSQWSRIRKDALRHAPSALLPDVFVWLAISFPVFLVLPAVLP